jgi:hypothetical protein
MKEEVRAAAKYFISLLKQSNSFEKRELRRLYYDLQLVMRRRYCNYWDKSNPYYYSLYRKIYVGRDLDPLLIQACEQAGVRAQKVFECLPKELTVWVDPFDVRIKIGNLGQVVYIFYYREDCYYNNIEEKNEK